RHLADHHRHEDARCHRAPDPHDQWRGLHLRGVPRQCAGAAQQPDRRTGQCLDQAKFLLSNERTSSADLYKARGDLERIRQIASHELKNGLPLIEDEGFARRFAMLRLEVEALEWSVLRVMHEAPSRHPIAACASVLKVCGSGLQQKLTELMVEALGQRSLRQYRRDEAY